jgi:hypothetical protein
LKKDEMLYETPVNEGSNPSGPTPDSSIILRDRKGII